MATGPLTHRMPFLTAHPIMLQATPSEFSARRLPHLRARRHRIRCNCTAPVAFARRTACPMPSLLGSWRLPDLAPGAAVNTTDTAQLLKHDAVPVSAACQGAATPSCRAPSRAWGFPRTRASPAHGLVYKHGERGRYKFCRVSGLDADIARVRQRGCGSRPRPQDRKLCPRRARAEFSSGLGFSRESGHLDSRGFVPTQGRRPRVDRTSICP